MFAKIFPGACAALLLSAGLAYANDAAQVQQSSSEVPVTIYPTGAKAHYCPAGLQPVSVDGSVSCGTPTTETTYAEAKATPYRSGGYRSCSVGAKGC